MKKKGQTGSGCFFGLIIGSSVFLIMYWLIGIPDFDMLKNTIVDDYEECMILCDELSYTEENCFFKCNEFKETCFINCANDKYHTSKQINERCN